MKMHLVLTVVLGVSCAACRDAATSTAPAASSYARLVDDLSARFPDARSGTADDPTMSRLANAIAEAEGASHEDRLRAAAFFGKKLEERDPGRAAKFFGYAIGLLGTPTGRRGVPSSPRERAP